MRDRSALPSTGVMPTCSFDALFSCTARTWRRHSIPMIRLQTYNKSLIISSQPLSRSLRYRLTIRNEHIIQELLWPLNHPPLNSLSIVNIIRFLSVDNPELDMQVDKEVPQPALPSLRSHGHLTSPWLGGMYWRSHSSKTRSQPPHP